MECTVVWIWNMVFDRSKRL